jgi:type I restriction enzyme M protein
VLFIDASGEYMNGKNQNYLRDVDVEKIVKVYRDSKSVAKYAYLAAFDEIEENDFNLNISYYVDTFEEEEEVDILAVQKEIEQLEADLASTRKEMGEYLKELDYERQQ